MSDNTFIVFLRGINVSGQKKIKMADLKSHLEELNYNSISTYIQSGNIVFTCEDKTAKQIQKEIENKILEKYGFKVPAFVLSAAEIKTVHARNPFLTIPNIDITKLCVAFLEKEPSPDKVAELLNIDTGSEKLVVDGRIVSLHLPNGFGRAKLTNNFIESKLGIMATTRNWKTVKKMYEMSIVVK